MHLPAGLGDVAAGTEDDLAVVGAEADLTRQHYRMLVLASVAMRRRQQPDFEQMLDYGPSPPLVLLDNLNTAPIEAMPRTRPHPAARR